MRTRIGVLAALALCVFGTVFAGERVLHVYTWSDYFNSDVLARFERANNCRVAVDYFESNEVMYAKLKAGGRRLRRHHPVILYVGRHGRAGYAPPHRPQPHPQPREHG